MEIGWMLARAVVLVLGLGAMGALYQVLATLADQRKYPPLGQRLDVGGYRLHLNCTGEGKPTVVFDSGAGNSSLDWLLVQPEVAKFTKVCTYDRAGYGWSDPSRLPRTSQQSVDELHTLLVKAGIEPPYVLVGHSRGGMNVRLYTSQYPEEVVGMVLVDSGHEDDRSHLTPEGRKQETKYLRLYNFARMVAPFGLVRLLGELGLVPEFEGFKKMLKKWSSQVQSMFDVIKAGWYQTHFLTAVYR